MNRAVLAAILSAGSVWAQRPSNPPCCSPGSPGPGLRGGRESDAGSGNRHDGSLLRCGLRFQRTSLGSEPRNPTHHRVRRERQIPSRLWRRLFTRSHGIRIDKDGNIWATDVGAHTVMKLSPQGQVLPDAGHQGAEPANGTTADSSCSTNRTTSYSAPTATCSSRRATRPERQRRSTRPQVRQERQIHQVVGRKRNRARQVRRGPRDRDRRKGPAVGDRSGESENPDFRSRTESTSAR